LILQGIKAEGIMADKQWDFSAAQLHRPRHHHANSSHHRIGTAGSTVSLQGAGAAGGRSQSNLPLASTRGHFHPAPPRSEVALLQPVMVSPPVHSLLSFLSLLLRSSVRSVIV
jgi:hypothetical protein